MYRMKASLGLILVVFMVSAAAISLGHIGNLGGLSASVQTLMTDLTVSVFANLSSATGQPFMASDAATGTLGNSYSSARVAVSAPEPKGWMLALAGVGLIGMMVSRGRHRM